MREGLNRSRERFCGTLIAANASANPAIAVPSPANGLRCSTNSTMPSGRVMDVGASFESARSQLSMPASPNHLQGLTNTVILAPSPSLPSQLTNDRTTPALHRKHLPRSHQQRSIVTSGVRNGLSLVTDPQLNLP
ncbi:hypothetical protein BSLG_001626 [Batrachochytrium salamandrivorans]|nr:hypothetical protein BSLG_001626 [Batrachochytrium salamandrivorans]